jgi:hypothetical protein
VHESAALGALGTRDKKPLRSHSANRMLRVPPKRHIVAARLQTKILGSDALLVGRHAELQKYVCNERLQDMKRC